MFSFWRLLQNENMKIYYRKGTWILIGLLVFADLFLSVIMKNTQGTDNPTNLWTFGLLSTNLIWLIEVFTVVIAGQIVASEFSWGTIKLLLIRPASRVQVLLSKYAAIVFFGLVLMVVLFFISIVFGAFFLGFHTTAKESVQMLGQILEVYSNRSIVVIMMFTFAFMLSTVFRNSSLATGLSLFVLFLSEPTVQVLQHFQVPWGKYILFANTDLTPYFQLEPPLFEGMTLGFSVTILLAYYLFFQFLAFFSFAKRDISV